MEQVCMPGGVVATAGIVPCYVLDIALLVLAGKGGPDHVSIGEDGQGVVLG